MNSPAPFFQLWNGEFVLRGVVLGQVFLLHGKDRGSPERNLNNRHVVTAASFCKRGCPESRFSGASGFLGIPLLLRLEHQAFHPRPPPTGPLPSFRYHDLSPGLSEVCCAYTGGWSSHYGRKKLACSGLNLM